MSTLAITYRPPESLTPRPRNARTHSKKQVRQIAASIERFGFTNPVLIDEAGTVLAGHGRVEAAKQLGLAEVPCVRLDRMSEDEKRAYVLADNKLAENAGWDGELLALELGELAEADLDFDLTLTGFSVGEIDAIIDAPVPEEPNDPADEALRKDAPRRANVGDVWQLGPHRLVCGDSLDAATVGLLMAGERARMVFTDPPYNVPVQGHVQTGQGRAKHDEFAMASGEMDRAGFTSFLKTALTRHAEHMLDGGIAFVCMDWRHLIELQTAGEAVFDELKNVIAWVKPNGGMGTFYRSRHELVFAFKKGGASHTNAFGLGEGGRYRTNVWEYRGATSMHADRAGELALHPTVKPVQMIADAIYDVSARGEIVLDLFGGSGSTLIAAEKTGRRARLCEIDPVYCDRMIARWEAYAKDEAVQLVCGIEQAGPEATSLTETSTPELEPA